VRLQYAIRLPRERLKIEISPAWRRASAFLLDLVIFFGIFVLYLSLFLEVMGIRELGQALQSLGILLKIGIATHCSSFLALLYFALLEFEFKATPGKALLELRVEGLDSYAKALLRNISKSSFLPGLFALSLASLSREPSLLLVASSFLLLLLLPLDCIPIFLGGRRASEIASGTKVIYEEKFKMFYGH
jgi:uncharacterized RDD family membrane protein YckC